MSKVVQCSANLLLYFKGENLADKDTFSKSDPYCVLFHSQPGGARGAIVGQTEKIQNDLNPQFNTAIPMEYFFEMKQELILVVFDDDEKGIAGDDVLATVPFQLAHVMSSRGSTLKKPTGEGANSFMYISAVETGTNGKDEIDIKFFGKQLAKMDMFGLSDPYFYLRRILPNGTKKELYKSEYINNTLDPKWNPCPKMLMKDLTGANLNAITLDFECWDSDTFSDDLIGNVQFSVQDLINNSTESSTNVARGSFTLTQKGDTRKRYGEILANCKVTHHPTFVEFLQAGQQINLAVSIDFTGSNGDPNDRRSLHFMNPNAPNQYVRAIMSVAEILMEYDTDKMVPAFGFGAKLPTGQVSHFFHLNQSENPYVFGVQGILDAYGRTLSAVKLAGPTNFAPTINAVTTGARNTPQVYTVLLIITDGEITDMQNTIDAIVEADDAPLSIVIVGVGVEDFQMMEQLDADNGALRSSRNRVSRRDLVQFVPFRDFERAPPGALSAEVLKEIPDQFCRWARITGMQPPSAQGGAPVPKA